MGKIRNLFLATGITALLGAGTFGALLGYDKIERNRARHTEDTFTVCLNDGHEIKETVEDELADYNISMIAQVRDELPCYEIDPAAEDDDEIAGMVAALNLDPGVDDAEFNYQNSIPEEHQRLLVQGEFYVREQTDRVSDALQETKQKVLEKVAKSLHLKVERASGPFNDPLSGQQWALGIMGWEKVPELLKGREGVEIPAAALDTGCGENADLQCDSDEVDGHGHGTHVAGIVNAETNNEYGIASGNFDQETIGAKKILDDSGRGNTIAIAKAIVDAANEGYKVINLSLGGPRGQTLLEKAVRYALSKGVEVVVAAGNADEDLQNTSPANIPGVWAVTSVAYDGGKVEKAFYSNYGRTATIAAPGGGLDSMIVSTIPEGKHQFDPKRIVQKGFGKAAGTSMAAPEVAALVRTMLEVDPQLSHKELVQIVQETATPFQQEKGKYMGPGVANAYEAIKKVCEQKDAREASMNWRMFLDAR